MKVDYVQSCFICTSTYASDSCHFKANPSYYLIYKYLSASLIFMAIFLNIITILLLSL